MGQISEIETDKSVIVCPISGKRIWEYAYGSSGQVSRYLTEFEEIQVIGAGGYGCVFQCRNKLDEQSYAVKKICLQDTDMDFDHVVREVKSMALMNHPNVVTYFSAWIEKELAGGFFEPGEEIGSYEAVKDVKGPVLFIQLELCSSSLSELMGKGAIEDDMIWKIFSDIIGGLQYIHEKNVMHGDLNPKNVFLDMEGTFKLGDFGLARLMKSGAFGKDSPKSFGQYTVPEFEEGCFSLASDMYSLGIILFELFAKFQTNMEKSRAFTEFKANRDSIYSYLDMQKGQLVLQLTDTEPSQRPDSSTPGLSWETLD